MQIIVQHVDTCLPDFFPGNFHAFICASALQRPASDFARELKEAVRDGAVGGSSDMAAALGGIRPNNPASPLQVYNLDELVCAAIDDYVVATFGDSVVFKGETVEPEAEDWPMAYFIITWEE